MGNSNDRITIIDRLPLDNIVNYMRSYYSDSDNTFNADVRITRHSTPTPPPCLLHDDIVSSSDESFHTTVSSQEHASIYSVTKDINSMEKSMIDEENNMIANLQPSQTNISMILSKKVSDISDMFLSVYGLTNTSKTTKIIVIHNDMNIPLIPIYTYIVIDNGEITINSVEMENDEIRKSLRNAFYAKKCKHTLTRDEIVDSVGTIVYPYDCKVVSRHHFSMEKI